MKRILTYSLVAVVAALTIAPAQAQYYTQPNFTYGGYRNINSLQRELRMRIDRGVANGRLNAREASRLRNKLSRINQIEARMRSTGYRLNFRERQKLQNQLVSLSNDITREMNDFERRRIGYWGNRFWR